MTSLRALRVGVLLGDNLVEERVFRDPPITIGQSLKCALSVPAAGVPREHVLVTRDQGRLLLHVPQGATGRLAQGEKVMNELSGTIALEQGARGKLTLGDATILFQEIAAPPLAPRPVLPASVRGTLADRIDRRLAAIIGASVLVHLGIAAFAWMDDVDTGSMLSTPVAVQYHQEVMEVTLPDEPAPPTITEAPGAAVPATPVQTPKPIVKPTRISTKTGAPAAATEDDAQRFASILTGSEIGRTGATDLNKRQPGTDLNKQIDDVGNREVVIGNDQTGFRTKPREGIGTEPNGPDINNPTEITAQKPKGEGEPKGRIQIKPLPPEGPGTTLTVQMVLDKIGGVYMTGLQRCYKKGLLGDSKLSGKVSMSFTVNERGGLDDAEARGVSPEVDSCIQGLMGSWHFAIPREKNGDPTEAPFKLSLALQPS